VSGQDDGGGGGRGRGRGGDVCVCVCVHAWLQHRARAALSTHNWKPERAMEHLISWNLADTRHIDT